MIYENFDLLIERQASSFAARVMGSAGGDGFEVFQLGISDLELENYLLRIGRPRRSTRRVNSPEMTAAKSLGAIVYSAVFSGTVRDCFRRSLADAESRGAGLRIRLRLRDVPELSDIPWEFLYDTTRNRFLGLSSNTPIVRYLDLNDPAKPLLVRPPLRALVIISAPHGYPKLDVQREWSNLQAAVNTPTSNGLLSFHLLDDARLPSLLQELDHNSYQIVHFIGHGVFNQQEDSGQLILEDNEGRGLPVSAEHFGNIISDYSSLRLVVLNACEGARNGRTDPFSGTAQTLVLQGVPSVIAMQWEITDDAAVLFAKALYSAIASGLPIDRSLSYARRVLYAEGAEVEWATPVLYMRSPDGSIFEVGGATKTETQRVDAAKLEVELKAEEASRATEEKRKAEEAARAAEEKRQAEETAELADEQRKAEEARVAEGERKAAEAQLAEKKRKADEAARVAEEHRKARAVVSDLVAKLAKPDPSLFGGLLLKETFTISDFVKAAKVTDDEARAAVRVLQREGWLEATWLPESDAGLRPRTFKWTEIGRSLAFARAVVPLAGEKAKQAPSDQRVRFIEENRKREDARPAEERRRAQEARLAVKGRKAEEAARAAEEKRKAEEAARQEEQRKAEEKPKAEEAASLAQELRQAKERDEAIRLPNERRRKNIRWAILAVFLVSAISATGIVVFREPSPPPPPPPPPMPSLTPHLSRTVFFDWDKATLSDRTRQIIKEVADYYGQVHFNRIEVNGYNDTSQDPEYSLTLSLRRADAVKAELIRDGVPADVIMVTGYGDTHPVIPTGPGIHEPQNRRVEMIVR